MLKQNAHGVFKTPCVGGQEWARVSLFLTPTPPTTPTPLPHTPTTHTQAACDRASASARTEAAAAAQSQMAAATAAHTATLAALRREQREVMEGVAKLEISPAWRRPGGWRLDWRGCIANKQRWAVPLPLPRLTTLRPLHNQKNTHYSSIVVARAACRLSLPHSLSPRSWASQSLL